MNPLDALSALTQIQAPLSTAAASPGAMPMGQTAPVSESFNNLLQATPATDAVNTTSAAAGAGPTTWGHMVQQMVMDVNHQEQNATAMVTDVLKGGPTPVHEAMIASEEASLSFEFLNQMRNKVVEAYNQVMQMQV